MKAVITGSEGFAGKYLVAELQSHGYQVVGLDLVESDITRKVDLRDAEATRRMIEEDKDADEIKAMWKDDVEQFKRQRQPYLLYKP